MSEDRRPLSWMQMAVAASVSIAGTVEVLRVTTATVEERLSNHIKLEEILRDGQGARIASLEGETRTLRDMVIRCEEGRK